MKLTLAEQETIIRYDREDKMATVYSCDPKMRRRMKEYLEKYPDVVLQESHDDVSDTYKVPKAYLSVSVRPRKKRVLTEEERNVLTERLNQSRKASRSKVYFHTFLR